jgi:cyclophilin family peptidyl-prolyl cis-trans isomerase
MACRFAGIRKTVFHSIALVLLCVVSAGCAEQESTGGRSPLDSLAKIEQTTKDLTTPPPAPEPAAESPDPAAGPVGAAIPPDVPSTGHFKVKFETSCGDFAVLVHREWAPVGAQRFYELVNAGFYNDCRFFRVVPDFMVQFGISGNPGTQEKWEQRIQDDRALKSNKRGYMTFATSGPNSRTTQVFINFKDNAFLDSQGFSPFAEVIEGMDSVDAIHSGYGEQPDQGQITSQGNAYLRKEFPDLDYVKKASIVEE